MSWFLWVMFVISVIRMFSVWFNFSGSLEHIMCIFLTVLFGFGLIIYYGIKFL